MRRIFLLLITVCVFSGSNINAQDTNDPTQGTLAAIDRKGAELGNCPLKNTTVAADISGFVARVTVTQEFANDFDVPIEAVYTFPLSANAAVDTMTMRVGERVIRGEILRKEDARRVYERAKSNGKTAALLDQERPNIFTQAVANILPGEKILIEISYVETLKFDAGGYEFVFPMTVAPRYIPASQNADDAEKISPPLVESRSGEDISVTVNLNAGVPVEEIRSPSHTIESLNLSANAAKVSLKNEKTIANKDFVLRYDVIGKRLEDAVLTDYSDRNGGFFSLILSPPERLGAADITPKEIVFVLDTSGSMSGFPIEKAKEAMKLAIDNLAPQDFFNLITFAGDTAILFDKPVPATRVNLDRAEEFLDSQRGGGGTEMMTAIKAALAPSDASDHIRVVCFMTDGKVGNDFEIISEVKKHKNARVFSFGIGDSVNRFLLDNIAKEGGGAAEYVLPTDDGEKAARRFYERVRNPYLTDVSIEWNGLPIADVYPRRIPDLFDAAPIVVFGRYTQSASGTIKLKGKIGGQNFERDIAVNLPADSGDDVLSTLWARTKIDDLMSQNWNFDNEAVNETPRLKSEIVKLGLDFRLLTQFTSFVAVEERIRSVGGKPQTVRVPANAPEEFFLQFQASTRGSKQMSGVGYGSGRGSGTGSGSGVGYGYGGNAPPPISPTKTISQGAINGSAINLPAPIYPAAARAVSVSGAVNVEVTIDEAGNVIAATAISGSSLLRSAAEKAAKQAKFTPTLLSGQPIKSTGTIVYNFAGTYEKIIKPTAEEIHPQTEAEAVEAERNIRETARQTLLAEKLHVWIFDLVERLSSGNSTPTATEKLFVKDDRAAVQIILRENTPESWRQLKAAGFILIKAKPARTFNGTIAPENVERLTEIGAVRYVLPRYIE